MDQSEQYEFSNSVSEIKEYIYLLWSWAWLIVLAGILAGGAAYAFSINTIPIYETSTRLLVSDPPILRSLDYSSMINSYAMTSTYAEMIVDRPVMQGVIDRLKLKIAPEMLKEQISVEKVRDTQLLVISVQDPNPTLAARIADTTAEVFTERINELQSERYADTRQGLAKQVSDMEQQIEATNQAIAVETNASKQLQLEARLTEYRRLFSNLVTSFEQVRLAEAQTSTTIVVSETAAIPSSPISPRTARNIGLAAATGLLLAAGLVFTFNALDDTIKNPEDVRQRFNLPILGVIASHKTVDGQLISIAQPRSPVVESFRSMRTNLTFTSVDKPLQRVMVTSPTPQIGKTTVVSNLGVVFAQGEKKVVLLDADLRRPQVHSRFGIQNNVGLSNLFLRPADVLLYGAALKCNVPNLAVITSGGQTPNPSELLSSLKMDEILKRLSEVYELILVDTPPVLTVTDATALAPAMDGVIVVVKPGVTRNNDLQMTIEQLQTVGGRVLGLVLNEVNPRSRRYGYYYHRYYSKYIYYYNESGKRKKVKQPKPTAQPSQTAKKRIA